MKVFSILKNLWQFAKDNLQIAKDYTDTEMNDLYYHVGDTVTNSNYIVVQGLVTGSAHSLFVTVPMGKKLDYVKNASVTVSKFTCGFRTGSGGYLNGDGYNYVTNSININKWICPETQTITIQFEINGAWGTNNTIYMAILNPENFAVTFS